MRSYDFSTQVAVVTGAGQQLGRAYALDIASRGASVIVNDIGRTPEGGWTADAVVAEIEGRGGTAVASHDSISSADGPRLLADFALERFGRVDVLVNNAGVARFAPIEGADIDELQMMLDVHLRGAYELSRRCLASMLERGYGRVVTMASSSGAFGLENHSAYATLKMALAGLTRSLAAEYPQADIKANAVQPRAPLPGRTKESRTQLKLGPFAYRLAPAFSAPLVTYLASRQCQPNGRVFTSAAGSFSEVFTSVAPPEGGSTLTGDELARALPGVTTPSVLSEPTFAVPALGDQSGRVVLVTGAATASSQAVARALAAAGAQVALTDRDLETVERLAAELPGEPLVMAADLAVEKEAAAVVERVVDSRGHLDALVVQGGAAARVSDLDALDGDAVDAALDAALIGPLLVTKYAFAELKRVSAGRLVTLVPAEGVLGARGDLLGGPLGSGLVGLVNIASLEGPQHGVQANAVAGAALGSEAADHRGLAAVAAALAGPDVDFSRGVHVAMDDGRVARVVTGLTRGWVSPGTEPPSAEELGAHLAEVAERAGYCVPVIVDEETDAAHDRLLAELDA